MTDRECKVNPVSSRVCEKGTKSCTIYYQDRELLCREFTELTGGHWHKFNPATESCSTCGNVFGAFDGEINPTYTNPADVLRVMMEFLNEDNLVKFARTVGIDYPIWGPIYIELKYIIEPDALLKAAVAFLKEGKK